MTALKIFVLPALLLGAGLYSFIPGSPPSSGPDGSSQPEETVCCDDSWTTVSFTGTAGSVVVAPPKIEGEGTTVDDIHIHACDSNGNKLKLNNPVLKVPKKNSKTGEWEMQDSGWTINAKPHSQSKTWYGEKGNGSPYKKAGYLKVSVHNTEQRKIKKVCYYWTRSGDQVNGPKTIVDMEPWIALTTNATTADLGGVQDFENQTSEPLAEISLSFLQQGTQTIVNVESTDPGYPVLEERKYVFEPPIEPGAWGSISWNYDELGSDPAVATQIQVTPTFLGYAVEPMAATTGPKQKQGRVRILRANGQSQILPPFKIKEFKVGGLPETLVIKCDANMSFVAGTGVALVSVGDLSVVAKPTIRAGGKELVLTIGKSKSRIKGEIRLTDLQVKLAKGAFGTARVYVPTGKSWRSVTVGVVR